MSVEENISIMRRWYKEVWHDRKNETRRDFECDGLISTVDKSQALTLDLRRRIMNRLPMRPHEALLRSP
jgi:hypothetical protein